MASFALAEVRPANIQNWIAVNASGSLLSNSEQSWMAYLKANGGTGNTFSDLERSFLLAQTATGSTLPDLWMSYLTTLAVPGLTVSEKLRNKYK